MLVLQIETPVTINLFRSGLIVISHTIVRNSSTSSRWCNDCAAQHSAVQRLWIDKYSGGYCTSTIDIPPRYLWLLFRPWVNRIPLQEGYKGAPFLWAQNPTAATLCVCVLLWCCFWIIVTLHEYIFVIKLNGINSFVPEDYEGTISLTFLMIKWNRILSKDSVIVNSSKSWSINWERIFPTGTTAKN